MKPSRVLSLAAKQTSKAFTDVRISAPRPTMDPNAPVLYLLDVSCQRGDGIVFTVTVQIDKTRYDQLREMGGLQVAALVINDGLKRLMDFLGCACTRDTECERHKRGAVN